MSRKQYSLLVIQALWELARWDFISAVRGFSRIYRQVERQRVASRPWFEASQAIVCDAVALAECLYWKRVYCFQRSVVATRLLRKAGIQAHLVIGYRPSPFLSHAWVEVNGRVVNDSPVYKERLHVLCTL